MSCSLGVKCPIKGEPRAQDSLGQISAPRTPPQGGAPSYTLSWSPQGPEPCFSSSPHLHPWIAFGTHLIKGVPEAPQEAHVLLHMVDEWLVEVLAQRGALQALRDPRGQLPKCLALTPPEERKSHTLPSPFQARIHLYHPHCNHSPSSQTQDTNPGPH